jgi:hypothetical protein
MKKLTWELTSQILVIVSCFGLIIMDLSSSNASKIPFALFLVAVALKTFLEILYPKFKKIFRWISFVLVIGFLFYYFILHVS